MSAPAKADLEREFRAVFHIAIANTLAFAIADVRTPSHLREEFKRDAKRHVLRYLAQPRKR